MVGSSCCENDVKVEAPMLSPADTNRVFGFSVLNCATAPASAAAPASWFLALASRRPWKSLMPSTWISVGMVLIEKIVVVPDTSLPTASMGLPVGESAAEMNVTPSGPRSPAADRSVAASAAKLRLLR